MNNLGGIGGITPTPEHKVTHVEAKLKIEPSLFTYEPSNATLTGRHITRTEESPVSKIAESHIFGVTELKKRINELSLDPTKVTQKTITELKAALANIPKSEQSELATKIHELSSFVSFIEAIDNDVLSPEIADHYTSMMAFQEDVDPALVASVAQKAQVLMSHLASYKGAYKKEAEQHVQKLIRNTTSQVSEFARLTKVSLQDELAMIDKWTAIFPEKMRAISNTINHRLTKAEKELEEAINSLQQQPKLKKALEEELQAVKEMRAKLPPYDLDYGIEYTLSNRYLEQLENAVHVMRNNLSACTQDMVDEIKSALSIVPQELQGNIPATLTKLEEFCGFSKELNRVPEGPSLEETLTPNLGLLAGHLERVSHVIKTVTNYIGAYKEEAYNESRKELHNITEDARVFSEESLATLSAQVDELNLWHNAPKTSLQANTVQAKVNSMHDLLEDAYKKLDAHVTTYEPSSSGFFSWLFARSIDEEANELMRIIKTQQEELARLIERLPPRGSVTSQERTELPVLSAKLQTRIEAHERELKQLEDMQTTERTWVQAIASIAIPLLQLTAKFAPSFPTHLPPPTKEELEDINAAAENLTSVLQHTDFMRKNEPTESMVARLTRDHPEIRPYVLRHMGEGKIAQEVIEEEVSFFKSDMVNTLVSRPIQERFGPVVPANVTKVSDAVATILPQAPPKAIQNEIEEVLTGTPDKTALRVDPKLLQHIVLDYAGSKKLEGHDTGKMLDYVFTVTEQVARATQGEEKVLYKTLADGLDNARNLLKLRRSNPELWISEFAKQTHGLEIGGTFFTELSWSSEGGNHAIVLEVIRKSDSDYNVRVYNRGEGLEFHSQALVGHEDVSLPFIELEHVSANDLANPPFALFLASIEEPSKKQFSPEQFYKGLLKILPNARPTSTTYTIEEAMETLKRGHCTFLSLTALMRPSLGKGPVYDRLLFFLRLRVTWDLYTQKKDELANDPQSAEALKLAIRELNRGLVNLGADVLSHDERLSITATLKKVTTALTTLDAEIHEAQRKATKPVQLNLPVARQEAKPVKHTVKDLYEQTTPPEKHALASPKDVIDSLSLNPNTLINELAGALSSTMSAKVSLEDKGRHLIHLIDRLSLDDSYWKEATRASSVYLFDQIEELMTALISTVSESQTLPSRHYLSQLKLLAITDQMARSLPDYDRVDAENLLPPGAIHFLQGEMPNDDQYDPQAHAQMRELQNYWLTKRTSNPEKPSFFNFETFGPDRPRRILAFDPNKQEAFLGGKAAVREEWPAHKWAEKWTENHREEVKALFPMFAEMSPRIWGYFALADRITQNFQYDPIATKPHLLPKAFHALKRQALCVAHFSHSAAEASSKYFTPELSVIYVPRDYQNPNELAVFKFNGPDHKEIEGKWTKQEKPNYDWDSFKSWKDFTSTRLKGEEPPPRYLYSNETETERLGALKLRVPPNERPLKQERLRSIYPDLGRELEAIGAYPELQASEALAFLARHPEAFEDADLLRYVTKQLFSLGAIKRHIEAGPDVARDFMRQARRVFSVEDNIALGEFDIVERKLEIARKLFTLLGDTKPIREELRSLNMPLQLALSYQYNKEVDARDLLAGLIHVDLKSDPTTSPEDVKTLLQIGSDRAKEVTRQLGKEDSAILPAILNKSGEVFIQDSAFPHIYHNKDKTIEVNIATGHVWQAGGTARNLPGDLQSIELIRTLLPTMGTLEWKEGNPGVFRTNTSDGEITIASRYPLQPIIQWRKDGVLYELKPEAQNDLASTMPATLTHNALIWTSESRTIITDNDSFRIKYRLEEDGTYYKHNSDLQLAKSAVNPFNRLDDPTFIAVWTDASGKIKQVELPRLKLTYSVREVNGMMRGYSDSHRSWYIANDTSQYVPALGALTDYVVMQDDKSADKQVWLVEHTYPTENAPPLVAPHKANYEEKSGFAKTLAIHRYRIDSQGELIPQTEEASYHLANVYFIQHEYDKARALITRYGTQVKALTETQKQILSRIARLDAGQIEPTPQSITVAMEAWYILIRDGWQNLEQKSKIAFFRSIQKELIPIYAEYIRMQDELGRDRLPPDKELLIMRSLGLYRGEGKPVGSNIEDYGRIYMRLQAIDPARFKKLELSPYMTPQHLKSDAVLSRDWHTSEKSEPFGHIRWVYSDSVKTLPEMREQRLVDYEIGMEILPIWSLIKEHSVESLTKLTTYLLGYSPEIEEKSELVTLLKEILRGYSLTAFSKPQRQVALVLIDLLENPDNYPDKEAVSEALFQDADLFDEHKALRDILAKKNDKEMFTVNPPTKWQMPISASTLYNLVETVYRYIRNDSHIEDKKSTRKAVSDVLIPMPPNEAYLHSVRLQPPAFELEAPIPELEEAIKEQPPKISEKQKMAVASLEKGLRQNAKNPDLQKAFSEVADEVKAYGESLQPQSEFVVKDKEALTHAALKLKEMAKTAIESFESLQDALVAFANKPPTDVALKTEQRARLLGDEDTVVHFDEIASFLLTQDAEAVHKRLPYLTPEEIQTLFARTIDVLRLGRHAQRLAFMSEQADALVRGSGDPSALARTLKELNNYKSPYDPSLHPARLVYDYQRSKDVSRFRIRQDQVEALDTLKKHKQNPITKREQGVLQEAVMGFGKTEVISVLLGVEEADGEKLVYLSMPDQLLNAKVEELQRYMGDSFDRMVEVIHFTRTTDVSEEALEFLIDKLEKIRTDRRYLLISSSSLLTLALRFVETTRSYCSDIQLERFSKIISLFRDYGHASLDEVDELLTILKSHQFTLGEPEKTHEAFTQAPTAIMRTILSDKELQSKVRLPFAPREDAPAFTEESYKTRLQPLLIQKVLEGKLAPELAPYLASLKPEQKALIATYLTGNPLREDGLFTLFERLTPAERIEVSRYIVGSINTLNVPLNEAELATIDRSMHDPAYELIRQAPPQARSLLAALKEQIGEILYLTASKTLGEHYGPPAPEDILAHPEMRFMAIPYNMGKPQKESQHGTESEIITYTMLMHLIKPIDRDLIKMELNRLKEQLAIDIRINEDTALCEFKRLTQNSDGYRLADEVSDDLVDHIASIINANPELKLELVERHVLPTLKRYSLQLSLSSQVVPLISKTANAFSGTPWNANTYRHLFSEIHVSDTRAKTLTLLQENSPQRVITIPRNVREKTLEEQVRVHITEGDLQATSLADLGGHFLGQDNEQVARAMLKMLPDTIQAVTYYNEQEKQMLAIRGEDIPVPAEMSRIPADKRAAFWPLKFCTGANDIIDPKAVATVTFNKNDMLRDGMQAFWRMRSLATTQRVQLAVDEEDRKVIEDELKRHLGITVEGELELYHIELYALLNEFQRIKSDTTRAFSQALTSHLIDRVFGALKGATTDEIRSLMISVEELFIERLASDPWELVGKTPGIVPKELAMQQELEKVFDSYAFRAFAYNKLLLKHYTSEQIEEELRQIAATFTDILPNEMSRASPHGRERAVEVETQKTTNIQLQRTTFNQVQDAAYTLAHKVREFKDALNPASWQPKSPRDIPRAGNMVMTINDVLQSTNLESFALFDENLLVDLNQMPLGDRRDTQPPTAPWNPYQQSISTAVVIRDQGKLRLALISQDTIHELLPLLAKKQEGNPSFSIALVNLESGLLEQESNAFDFEALEHDPEFIKLKTQAKLYSGYLSFTKDEQTYLESWFKEINNPDLLEKMVREHILVNLPSKLQEYPASYLGIIIKRAKDLLG